MPRVVVLREDHRLAAHSGLRLAQLAGLPIIRWGGLRPNGFLLWPPDEIDAVSWTAGPVIGDSSEFRADRPDPSFRFRPSTARRSWTYASRGR